MVKKAFFENADSTGPALLCCLRLGSVFLAPPAFWSLGRLLPALVAMQKMVAGVHCSRRTRVYRKEIYLGHGVQRHS